MEELQLVELTKDFSPLTIRNGTTPGVLPTVTGATSFLTEAGDLFFNILASFAV